VTISFMPDGTVMGGATSNLFQTFNAKWSTATWEVQILKAAQVWAQQTNLNFAAINDSGAPSGSGNYQQGDPTMGDIRIGGYNFNSCTLADAYMPPSANNFSIAGDIAFNTGQTFNIGSTYDLFTVAVHEFGHALGLLHSTSSSAVMYANYGSVKYGLSSDDIAGIRNIYSNNNPRSKDAYNGTDNSFANAADITALINTANDTALLANMDITTAGQKAYYRVTAPCGTGSTVTIDVQSSGLSLLAPTVTIYAADQVTVLGSANGAGQYGTTLTVNLTNQVWAGQVIYVKVGGADTTALGTGKYAVTMSFAGAGLPAVPLPNTQLANGNPLSGGGGLAMTDPTQGSTVSNTPSWVNMFMSHAPGCGCAACRAAAAAAAVQQAQTLVIGWERVSANPTATGVGLSTMSGVPAFTPASSAWEQILAASQGMQTRGFGTATTSPVVGQSVVGSRYEGGSVNADLLARVDAGLSDAGFVAEAWL
jgi:hypothetical protein